VRILLDECVPARLRRAFPGYAVKTVTECGWRSGKDFALLAFAEKAFDIFVTVDRKLARENDLSRYRLGFVVAGVLNNRLEAFEPLFEDLRLAAQNVKPGQMIFVERSP
jgi:predicted nuclease of predicted toxin-antitoxin system